jgi:hypothetical protein
MAHCHCTMCRKFHGAAYSTFGEAKLENFKWLAGEDKLVQYVADNGSVRQFCKTCGSSLTFVPEEGCEYIEFSLGTLDTEITLLPNAHIFMDFKACWDKTCDDLPKFRQNRDSEKLD